MDSYVEGEHDHCGVYCAVMAGRGVEGASQDEIVQDFVQTLTSEFEDHGAEHLQKGLAHLLRYVLDAAPADKSLYAALTRYLDGEAA